MIVQEFIDELSRRLRDVNKKQWDDDFLISATNAALGALTTVMPQSFTVNRDLALVGGTEQEIDPDLHRIVTMLHNISTVDGTPRRAITKADMSVLDAACPHWRQDPSRNYIRHWMVDEFDESKFYVWPPAPTEDPLSIRGTFTRTPYISRTVLPEVPEEPVEPVDIDDGAYQADLAAYNALLAEYNAAQAALEAYIEDESEVRVDDELPVKRAHIPALQEFAMYYAYSVDDDLTPNSGRAQRHWLAFFQILNKREDATLMIGNAAEITE